MIAKKFNQFITESLGEADDMYGTFFIRLLGLRDQAHIFHWQTTSFARHSAFGDFYTEYLTAVDVLAEMIMGIKGRPVMGTNATIMLKDYSDESISEFIENSEKLLGAELEMICNPAENEEVFDQARIILAEIDKLKYLLTLENERR